MKRGQHMRGERHMGAPRPTNRHPITIVMAVSCLVAAVIVASISLAWPDDRPSDDAPPVTVNDRLVSRQAADGIADAAARWAASADQADAAPADDTTATGEASAPEDDRPSYEAGVVLVDFAEGATAAEIEEAVAATGIAEGTVRVSDDDLASGFMKVALAEGVGVEEAAAALDAVPGGVVSGTPNYLRYIHDDDELDVNDELQHLQWALSDISVRKAWKLARGDAPASGERVTVAVIDNGFELTHTDLAANLVAAYDATNNTSDTSVIKPYAHGTHTSGIVAAVANNGKGIAGISYNARVMPLAAGSVDDERVLTTEAERNAYRRVVDMVDAGELNVRVVSMSYGGHDEDPVAAALFAELQEHGVVCVASAGNEGQATITYPCDYEGVVGVMALDEDGALASYSNYNPAGATGKQISAPGTRIASTASGEGTTNGYMYMNGTSQAAPIISGVLALEFSANPDLSAEAAVAALYNTARDLGDEGWDASFGYGDVDAYAAIRAVQSYGDGTAVDAVQALVDALPGPSDYDPGRVEEAIAAYLALTDDQKLLVSASRLFAAASLPSILDALDLIDGLPALEDLTVASQEAVSAARAAHDALPADMPADYRAFADASLPVLEDAETMLLLQDLAASVDASSLGRDVIALLSFNEDAQALLSYYHDNAEHRLKALLDAEGIDELMRRIAVYASRPGLLVLQDRIDALPDGGSVTLADAAEVRELLSAYDELTDEDAALVDATRLRVAALRLRCLADPSAATVQALVDALPGPLDDAYDASLVAAARAALEALPAARRALVDTVRLVTCEARDALVATQALVDALPASNELSLDDLVAVMAARDAYDALPVAAQALLTGVRRLTLDEYYLYEAVSQGALAEAGHAETYECLARMTSALSNDAGLRDALCGPDELVSAYLGLMSGSPFELSDGAIPAESLAGALAARKTFALLSAEAQAELRATVNSPFSEDSLVAAEVALARQLVVSLPDAGDAGFATAVDDARAAFDWLTDEQRAVLGEEVAVALEHAVAEALSARVEALPAAPAVTVADGASVADAAELRAWLDARGQEGLVEADTLSRLAGCEAELGWEVVGALADADRSTASLVRIVDEVASALPADGAVDEDAAADVASAAWARHLLEPAWLSEIDDGELGRLVAAESTVALRLASALPSSSSATTSDGAAVDEALALYDLLSRDQRAELGEGALVRLGAAEAGVARAMIETLPDAADISLAHRADIDAALAAWDALAPWQRTLAGSDRHLVDAAARLAALLVDELPAAADVTLDDRPAIEAARALYDRLSEEDRAGVDVEHLMDDVVALVVALTGQLPANASEVWYYYDAEVIETARALDTWLPEDRRDADIAAFLDVAAAYAVIDGVSAALPASPDDVTATDLFELERLVALYDGLGEDVRVQVDPATLKAVAARMAEVLAESLPEGCPTLLDATTVSSLHRLQSSLPDDWADVDVPMADDALFAAEVRALIAALPDPSGTALEGAVGRAQVAAARAAYQALDDAGREAVGPTTRLEACEVALTIADLPAPKAIAEGDAQAVATARAAYDALDVAAQSLIGPVRADTLAACEAALEALAAQVVQDAINALPDPAAVTEGDAPVIEAIRAAYGELSEAAQALVVTDRLVACEDALASVRAAQAVQDAVDALPDPAGAALETDEARAQVSAARASLDALDDAPKAHVDVTRLEACEVALTIADLPAPKAVMIGDAPVVAAARSAYEALSDAARVLVGTVRSDALAACEAVLEELMADPPEEGAMGTITIRGVDDASAKNAVVGYQLFTLGTVDDDNATEAAAWAGAAGPDGTPVERAVVGFLMEGDEPASHAAYYTWLVDRGYLSETDTAARKHDVEHTARVALAYVTEQIEASAGATQGSLFVPDADTFAVRLAAAVAAYRDAAGTPVPSEVRADAVINPLYDPNADGGTPAGEPYVTDGKVTFAARTDANGYWLFLPATVTVDGGTILDQVDASVPPILTVRHANVTTDVADLKSTRASLDKRVLDEAGVPSAIVDTCAGTTLTYVLTARLGGIGSGEATIVDVPDAGIMIDLGSVTVEGPDGPLESDADYTVAYVEATNQMSVTVAEAMAGTYILTYDATLTTAATMGVGAGDGQGPNRNRATLVYDGQTTIASVARVVTYRLELLGRDRDTAAALAGTTFAIQMRRAEGDDALWLQADGSLGISEDTFVAGPDGTIVVPHIDAGTYTVIERGVPEGYEPLSPGSFQIEIPSAFDASLGDAVDGYSVSVWDIGGSGVTTRAEVDADAGLVRASVPYARAARLPVTGMTHGQLGTVVGALLVAAGIVALAFRRRARES